MGMDEEDEWRSSPNRSEVSTAHHLNEPIRVKVLGVVRAIPTTFHHIPRILCRAAVPMTGCSEWNNKRWPRVTGSTSVVGFDIPFGGQVAGRLLRQSQNSAHYVDNSSAN